MENIEHNKILEIVTGSFLYGTNQETSDKDYVGIFLPTEDMVFGFTRCDEVDLSIKDKNENGKNNPDAIDKKLYEFRKFIRLALDNNPNILEMLFVNEENKLFVSPEGKELLEISSLFPHKGLKQKFLGYAFAQKHKMVIKKDNYFELNSAYDYLSKVDDSQFLLETVLKNTPYFIKFGRDEAHNIKNVIIGDLQFPASKLIRDVKKTLKYRLDSVGNREELLLKYGYDVKFGMHLVRLMLEGIELLKTNKLTFPLKDREMLKDIRNGKWGLMKILEFSNELEKEIESISESSKLPSNPRTHEIEKFTIKMLRKKLCQ